MTQHIGFNVISAVDAAKCEIPKGFPVDSCLLNNEITLIKNIERPTHAKQCLLTSDGDNLIKLRMASCWNSFSNHSNKQESAGDPEGKTFY